MDTARGAFVLPATPPSQFDPQQLLQSVDRLAAYAPRYLYLMHYGRVTDVPRLALDLKHQIREFERIALEHEHAADPAGAIDAALRALWRELAEQHGCNFTEAGFNDMLDKDVNLNVQGLIAWLARRKKAQGRAQ